MVRLGYACINTVLRAENIYTNRTLRLATLKEKGVEYAKELGLLNIKDLVPIIQWNEDNGIKFMRLSSTVFPFASDVVYGYSLKYAERELKAAGDLAQKYGHRLTVHPGQYNVLCSPNENIVKKSHLDLSYHAEMLDLMGVGKDGVMIIHMGGVYGDKPAAIARFEKNFMELPQHVRDRLVLENDEIMYSVEELLPTCKKLKIPLVMDWHHDRLRQSALPVQSYLAEIDAIWKERGIRPKQHYSESAKGHPNPRTHSDYILRLPPCAADMDLMIEAKMKEQTVLRICKKYGITPTNDIAPETITVTDTPEELAEPEVELEGKGRKKHTWTKSKVKDEGEEGEESEEKPKKKKRVTARKTIRGKSVKKEVKKEVTDDGEEIITKKKTRKSKTPEGDEVTTTIKKTKKEKADGEVDLIVTKKRAKKDKGDKEEDVVVTKKIRKIKSEEEDEITVVKKVKKDMQTGEEVAVEKKQKRVKYDDGEVQLENKKKVTKTSKKRKPVITSDGEDDEDFEPTDELKVTRKTNRRGVTVEKRMRKSEAIVEDEEECGPMDIVIEIEETKVTGTPSSISSRRRKHKAVSAAP